VQGIVAQPSSALRRRTSATHILVGVARRDRAHDSDERVANARLHSVDLLTRVDSRRVDSKSRRADNHGVT
jgi:hypothetical protein